MLPGPAVPGSCLGLLWAILSTSTVCYRAFGTPKLLECNPHSIPKQAGVLDCTPDWHSRLDWHSTFPSKIGWSFGLLHSTESHSKCPAEKQQKFPPSKSPFGKLQKMILLLVLTIRLRVNILLYGVWNGRIRFCRLGSSAQFKIDCAE